MGTSAAKDANDREETAVSVFFQTIIQELKLKFEVTAVTLITLAPRKI